MYFRNNPQDRRVKNVVNVQATAGKLIWAAVGGTFDWKIHKTNPNRPISCLPFILGQKKRYFLSLPHILESPCDLVLINETEEDFQ